MEILRLTGFDNIKNNLAILKNEYLTYEKENLIRNRSNFFVFPEKLFKEINEVIEKINNLLIYGINIKDEDIKKVYNSLSSKIYVFYHEIKLSSYENLIFNSIKSVMEEIMNFIQSSDSKMDKIKETKDDSSQFLEYYEDDSRIENAEKNFYDSNSHINNNQINIRNLSFKDSKMDLSEVNVEDEVKSGDEDFVEEAFHPYENIKEKYNYISYYANVLIKNESFNKESFGYLKTTFPECELLYDFKKIKEELIIKQCKITKDKLDFRYNFIIPNLDLKREKGGEKYYPPYGWFGIGLNIKNIYKNNKEENIEKANAYFEFKDMNSRGIKIMLNNIIMGNKFNIDPYSQPKCRYSDKRKNGPKVGPGIYLSPNIKMIEQNTGIVYCNNKAYKIALMARVLSNKIRQPDDNDWVLNPIDIEFTRIIFKEIYL